MYKIQRVMLMTTVSLYVLSIIVLCLRAGKGGWVILAILFAVAFRRKAKQLWAYGTGSWAKRGAMVRAGMLSAGSGLILGRLTEKPGPLAKIKAIFDRGLSAKAACEAFASTGKELIRLPERTPHTLVCAPSGAGKGVSVIIPWLQTCNESAVVVDPKGENAAITAETRRKMGQDVRLLDPWHLITDHPDTLNPLDYIDHSSTRAVDECNSVANALVVRTGQEKEPHWNDKAEAFLSATIAASVFYGQRDKGTRSLLKVADMLSNPTELQLVIKLMKESPEVWGGSLARMGGQLSHSSGEELSSTLSTVSRFIRFLNTPAVAESVHTSSFDPSQLRRGKLTCYLILPTEFLSSHAAVMRLWLVSLMGSVVRGGLQ
jgi:type IV secretion system protein VirD4